MSEQLLEVDLGVLCTWEVAERTSYATLRQHLPVDFIHLLPNQKRHKKSILRDSIRAYYGNDSSIVIRPQESDDVLKGFSVFKETRNKPDSPNDLQAVATIAVDNDGQVSVPTGDADASKIQEFFNNFENLLSASMVSSIFIQAIDKLGGTGGVRPAGGVYFLLHDGVAKFKEIVSAASTAAVQGRTEVFMFTLRKDPKTIDSVHKSIVRELRQFITQTTETVASGSIGKVGLKTQIDEIKRQMSRLNKFEESLGQFSENVKQELETLQQTALVAHMHLLGQELNG